MMILACCYAEQNRLFFCQINLLKRPVLDRNEGRHESKWTDQLIDGSCESLMNKNQGTRQEFLFVELQLVYQAVEPGRLQVNKGSMLRGALGHALKSLECLTGYGNCSDCMHLTDCLYAYVFETPCACADHQDHLHFPHPFIIQTKNHRTRFEAGDSLYVRLKLMGKSIVAYERMIQALLMAGCAGFGINQMPFQLVRVTDIGDSDEPVIWDAATGALKEPAVRLLPLPAHPSQQQLSTSDPGPESVTLTFETPLRMLERKQLLVAPSFTSIMRGIFRRADLLLKAHLEQPLDIHYKEWLAAANQVNLSAWTGQRSQTNRYSNRQHQKIQMHGVTGSFTYSWKNIQVFLPYLRLGEVIHIGKGTVMGAGQYSLGVHHNQTASRVESKTPL